MLSLKAAPAPRLRGLVLLGSTVLEPDLQSKGKTTIHAIPSSCLVQCLQGLTLLGSTILEPDLQPEDISTVNIQPYCLSSYRS